jgi:hypothetical protein
MLSQKKTLASQMTPYEFSLYLKNARDRVFYFDKYRTDQRRNGPTFIDKAVRHSMKRRKSK